MTDPRISSEEKLLIYLCRLEFSAEQKKEIGELMKEVKDWDWFVKLVNAHGIIALSWYNITNTNNAGLMPPQYLNILHNSYLKNLARNTYLYDQLSKILGIIRSENIKVVLLKGIALEKTIYGNQGLRQMTDLDVLADPGVVLELRRILIKNGFRSGPFKSPLYRYLIPHLNAHIPRLTKDDCHLEIHYKIFDERGYSLSKKILELSTPLKIEENTAFIPPPQLFFLYLVSHLGHHSASGDSQLRMYTDIYLLLLSRYEEIVSTELIDNAKEADLEEQLSCVLYLLKQYWGVEYPVWLNDFINQSDHTPEEKSFHSFLKAPDTVWSKGKSSNYTKQITIIPGIFRKILYVIGFILPSPAFMKKRYGTKTKARAVLYYPVRWERSVVLFLQSLFKD